VELSSVVQEEEVTFCSPFILTFHPRGDIYPERDSTLERDKPFLYNTINDIFRKGAIYAGGSKYPHLSSIYNVDIAIIRLRNYVGSYLDSLDLKKSYITGSSISAAFVKAMSVDLPSRTINTDDFNETYPHIYTRPNDIVLYRYILERIFLHATKPCISGKDQVVDRFSDHPSIAFPTQFPASFVYDRKEGSLPNNIDMFLHYAGTSLQGSPPIYQPIQPISLDNTYLWDIKEDEEIEEEKEHPKISLVWKSDTCVEMILTEEDDETRVNFNISSGADVDICVECEKDEFEGIVRDHYSKVKAIYPETELIPSGNAYKIRATTRRTMLKFREVEMYRVDPKTALYRMCTHHLPMARACYTNANSEKLFKVPKIIEVRYSKIDSKKEVDDEEKISDEEKIDEAPEFYFTASFLESMIHRTYKDYHYFDSKKVLPQEIILKYEKRGFTFADKFVHDSNGDHIDIFDDYKKMTGKWSDNFIFPVGSDKTLTNGNKRKVMFMTIFGLGDFNIFSLLSMLTNEDLSEDVIISLPSGSINQFLSKF